MYKGVTSDIRELGICHLYLVFLQHSNTHFQTAVEMAYSQLNSAYLNLKNATATCVSWAGRECGREEMSKKIRFYQT